MIDFNEIKRLDDHWQVFTSLCENIQKLPAGPARVETLKRARQFGDRIDAILEGIQRRRGDKVNDTPSAPALLKPYWRASWERQAAAVKKAYRLKKRSYKR